MRPVVLVLAVLGLLLGSVAPAAAGPRADRAAHRWPVADPVVTRAFDLPLAEWRPGHRGVDLHAPPGTPVGASAPGEVTFAGSVAGTTWVSIAHPDGVTTTYGPLRSLVVEAGDRVAAGALLGEAAGPGGAHPDHDGLHWAARRGGRYVDPLDLLAGVLVPSLVGPGGWTVAGEHPRHTYAPWDGRETSWGFLPGTRPAEAPGWLAAPTPNHVIGVPGLLTRTGSTPLPLDFLGYAPADTTYLGHAGRHDDHDPVVDADDPWRDQLPHDALDTLQGVHASALLLRDQLRAQWARQPGVAVDLVGHSMGGVVVLHYLLALHDPADPTLPPVANVVTLASPLEGADLATAGQQLRDDLGSVGVAIHLAAALLDAPLYDGSLDDLALDSPLLAELGAAWKAAREDPHRSPLAGGTRLLTIGGATDAVVPEHRSDLPGAPHVVVPGGHTAMHESEATLQVVRAFLAGQEVPAGDGSWGAWLSPGWSLLTLSLAALATS